METIIQNLSDKTPRSDEEYLAEDGFLHCAKCGEAVQTRIVVFEKEKIVRCICKCKKEELERDKERHLKTSRDIQRRICFEESNMWNWNFANDDLKNPKLTAAMKRYVEKFEEFKQEGRGLLLHGEVGTGKSYLAACVANELIDKGYKAYMTNFARLTNQLQEKFDGKQKYIDSLNRFHLLIIDDLGTERKSEYMQEQVYNIIDARYRSGLPFIITTNLTTEEIKKPQEIERARIYDRILERCFPIAVTGTSRRRQSVKESFFDTKEKLGL